MDHPLPAPLASLAPVLDRYGYLALALFVLLEGVGIPTPAVTIVVTASVYAGAGGMDIIAVALVTLAAATAGDNLGYLLGRSAGRPLVLRWGRYLGLNERRLARAEDFFVHRGGNVVIFARFVDGLRQTNGLIAGSIAMPWPRYLVRDGAGALLWTGLWVSLGYLAGDNIEAVYGTARRYQLVLLAVVLALVTVLAVRLWRRRRHRAAG